MKSVLQNVENDEKSNIFGVLHGSEGKRNIAVSAHMAHGLPRQYRPYHLRAAGPGHRRRRCRQKPWSGGGRLPARPAQPPEHPPEKKPHPDWHRPESGQGQTPKDSAPPEQLQTARACRVCVEGVQLDRLSHASIGIIRGEVLVRTPEELDWNGFGNTSAILTLNEIINKITDIPLPRRPRSSIILGQVRAGAAMNKRATKPDWASKHARSRPGLCAKLSFASKEAVSEVASKTGDDITIDIFSTRQPGGISFGHPLVRASRDIFDALQIKPPLRTQHLRSGRPLLTAASRR